MTKIQLTAPNALTKTEDCASPIPHKIHLPWLSASPEAIERNRIVDWANKNPTATIYLWVDSKHFVTEQQSENRFEKNDSEMKTHKRIVKRTPNSMNALMASENQRKRMDVDTVLANFPPKIAAQGYYRSGGVISDLKRFNELANNFKSLSNVQVKDVSNCQDIRMINWDAYQYQVMKKDSRTALVIVRDEILYQYGGVFADATLTCKQPLMFDELLCHERWALLGGMANPNIGKPGKESAFLPEPVIACHPRNIIVKMRIDSVRSEFQNLKKNQILGARYWVHTRPSTDRFRHPLSIKNSVIGALKEYMTEQGLENDHATIISTLSAYCTFPLGYIELI